VAVVGGEAEVEEAVTEEEEEVLEAEVE